MKPVAWTTMPDADDWGFVSGSKNPNNHLEGVWHPLFTAPPEPAHSDHPMRHYDRTCPACNEGAAPSSEEVREMVDELREAFPAAAYRHAVIETQALKKSAADLIERLAKNQVPYRCVVVRLTDYINAASINASDAPHIVVEKLQAAIDAAGEVKP